MPAKVYPTLPVLPTDTLTLIIIIILIKTKIANGYQPAWCMHKDVYFLNDAPLKLILLTYVRTVACFALFLFSIKNVRWNTYKLPRLLSQ